MGAWGFGRDASTLHAPTLHARTLLRAPTLLTLYAQTDHALVRELAGVAQEVEQGLPHLRHVGTHWAYVGLAIHFELVAVFGDQRLDGGGNLVHQLGYVELLDK